MLLCFESYFAHQSQFPTLTAGAEGIVAVASHDDCDTVVTGAYSAAIWHIVSSLRDFTAKYNYNLSIVTDIITSLYNAAAV
jgi:hypothetical protein